MNIFKKLNIKISAIILLLFFICTVVLSLVFPPSENSNSVKKLKELHKNSKMWQDENGVFWDDLFYEVNKIHFDDFNDIDDLNLSAYPEGAQDKIMIMDALSKNYNDLDRFLAVYKNTVLGWFAKSKKIERNYYIVSSYDRVEYDQLYKGYYLLYIFPKYLPYIFICLIIYLWIRVFNKPKV